MENSDIKFLKKCLSKGIVQVVFIKKDGSERIMNCTLLEQQISKDQLPKNTGKKQNDDVIAVFDIDNNGWRSFRFDSVKSIRVEETITY